jgi:heme-degrading monooxygenase HmoA
VTQVVISQAWLLPGEEHAAAYEATARSLDDYLRAQPGFVQRLLVRGVEDPTHLVHVREWVSVDDYLRMTADPTYQAHIEQLSQHVDVSRYGDGYPREFADVIVATRA